MRKFLIVGCGGSGGATVQFLMDQLRATLADAEIDELPAGWQFLHIDVPERGDGVAPGMPPLVAQQGGTYVGVARQGLTYLDLSQSVEQRLAQTAAVDGMVGWYRDPHRVMTAITQGAGQQRAVGRTATLAAAQKIRDELVRAWSALKQPAATNELTAVARTLSPDTIDAVGGNPVVLIVSSMAGGAGASMVLDVARILGGIDPEAPPLTALFLYTGEVFTHGLPSDRVTGVRGNGLAMFGELMATTLGVAGREDARLLEAIGVPVTAGPTFQRVVPIGVRSGLSGAVFGDGTLTGVYRGIGRGLAALMTSGLATQEWTAYTLTNSNPRAEGTPMLGWGSNSPADFQWATFGYASLGMGRDRYEEYSAQRIARVAVDRLLYGFRQPGDQRPDSLQLASVVDALLDNFLERLELPRRGVVARDWMTARLADSPGEAAVEIVREQLASHLRVPGQVQAQTWIDTALHRVALSRDALARSADAAGYGWAHAWHLGLLARMEQESQEVIAQHGLAVLRGLLTATAEQAATWVADLDDAGGVEAKDPTALDPAFAARLGTLGKTMINETHGAVATLTRQYRTAVAARAAAAATTTVRKILPSFATGAALPLADTTNALIDELTQLSGTSRQASGLAALRTDRVSLWPGAGPAPTRFTEAPNEVLLTSVEDYQGFFDQHLQASVGDRAIGDLAASADDALAEVVGAVLMNRWKAAGVMSAPGFLERTATWRPGALPTEPGDATGNVRLERKGGYLLRVLPSEILERARNWVRRPGEPFHTFIQQTIGEYVLGPHVAAAERTTRQDQLVDGLRSALQLASPLAAASQRLVQAIHGESLETSFVFTAVDIPDALLQRRLLEVAQTSGATVESRTQLAAALGTGAPAVRLNIFGSFAPLNPLALTSLSKPLAEGWRTAYTTGTEQEFWTARRARGLVGSLPMTELERAALVGGWYVSRLTGRLRFPHEHPGRAVQVYDQAAENGAGGWIDFPPHLLVEEQEHLSAGDYLPAVLLSYLLALVNAGEVEALAPLRPYHVTRQYWDDSRNGVPLGGSVTRLAAAQHVQAWLRAGDAPEGAPPTVAGAADRSEAARGQEMLTAVQKARLQVTQYLAPGEAPGASFQLPPVGLFDQVPFRHQIAKDIYVALGSMETMLHRAMNTTVPTEDEFL